MAVTRAELQKLLEAEGLRYFLDPQRDALMVGCQGANGRYQFVIHLDLEGTFLQMRTISYHHCPTDHKHVLPLLKLLGSMNYELRLVKFGYDPTDGEIVVYADLWVMDGTVTQQQFSRMLHNYLPSMDVCYARILKTMETGVDPGLADPVAALASGAGDGLPGPLRRLLESLAEAAKGTEGKDHADEGKKDKTRGEREKITKL
jgi:hypothetical protein